MNANQYQRLEANSNPMQNMNAYPPQPLPYAQPYYNQNPPGGKDGRMFGGHAGYVANQNEGNRYLPSNPAYPTLDRID